MEGRPTRRQPYKEERRVKRTLYVTLMVLLVAAPTAHAGWLFSCCNLGIHCIEPPTYCPDCSEPSCPHHCSKWKSEQAQKLVAQLSQGNCCCERIKAAEKLGCRLFADWRCDPEVLTVLVEALECDTCWEVRKAAAWSIGHQNARTRYGVMALYLAGKVDPHYMVREAAKEALDVMLVCRRDCYKDLFDSADASAKKLKPYYKPTTGQCVHLIEEGCGFTIHVCKKVEAPKPPKPEVCLIPINIVEDICPGPACPNCHGVVLPGAPATLPAPPGIVPPGPVPERLTVPPTPTVPEKK